MKEQQQMFFDLIKKYCGQELSFRLQGVLRNLESTNVKIVNTGMVSSGKSSLYNLLTDNIMTERFPTGAARTTTCADIFNYKNMEYIDTPGIDVRDVDDEIAYCTVMESDIVLMVHNIKTGPLTRSESDWLTRIVKGMKDPEMCKCRIIFICTWKDAREREPGYEEILDEVKRMVFNIVGTEIPFFDVSVKKYLDAVKKRKEVLREKSGIPVLKDFVEGYALEYANKKQKFALDAFEEVAKEVLSTLELSHNDRKEILEKKKMEAAKSFSSQRRSWKGIFSYFKKRREILDCRKQELETI